MLLPRLHAHQDKGNTTKLLQQDFVFIMPRYDRHPRWPETLCVFSSEQYRVQSRASDLWPPDPLSGGLYLATHELRLVMHVLFPAV